MVVLTVRYCISLDDTPSAILDIKTTLAVIDGIIAYRGIITVPDTDVVRSAIERVVAEVYVIAIS
jgi:hypothetical protein